MPEYDVEVEMMISKIHPIPGDVIVACLSKRQSLEVTQNIVGMLRGRFPNNDCLVLDPDVRLDVVHDRHKLAQDFEAKREVDDGEDETKAEAEHGDCEAQVAVVHEEQGA